MDAFMKDVLNVKPILLKQNAPEMDAFQHRLFNSQRKTYFLLKPDAPKTNAFHVKDVVNIEPFLFDTMPPKWMPLRKMWSQFFYSKMPPKWMPFSKDFLILSVKPIFCWNLMPPEPMPFMSKMLSTLNFEPFFVWHNAPKMDAFMKDVLNVKPVLLKQNALEMDAF